MVTQQGMSNLDRLVAELQQEIDAKEAEIYSARVLQQARQPTNFGRMDCPDAQARFTGWCGDTMEVFLRFNGHAVQQATFLTDGCGPSVACGNMLSTMVQGLSLAEAAAIHPEDLIQALDGLPDESTHCAELAVQTLRQALSNLQAQDSREAE